MQSIRYRLVYFLIFLLYSSALSSEKQIEITNYLAKLYLAPSVNSKFLGLAQKGERYNIQIVSNYWYRIDYKGSLAWIESSNTQVIDPNAESTPSSTESPKPESSLETKPIDSVINQPAINNNTVTTYEPSVKQPVISQINTEKRLAQSKIRDSISQNSKLRRWISRQSLSKLPIIEQNVEGELKDKFFLVTSSTAKVLLVLSPDSPILGMANKGEHLSLIGEGESWCKVSYKDTVGWIERKYGKVVTTNSFPVFLYFGIAIIVIIIAVLIILFITFKLFKKKASSKQSIITKKKALIIARESKSVIGTLTDTNNTIEKCFQEIGFEFKTTPDVQNIKGTINQYNPDVILIDWRFDRTIVSTIENLFTAATQPESKIIIVYNIPDPSLMSSSPALPNMSFLGISFSDRDLFKIITSLILSSEDTQNLQRSIQSCALEGEIAGGNLLEVLQYIEVGKKIGCLLIDTGIPFCMIYFDDGRIIYAATAEGQIGRDALYSVLNLKAGKFRFLINKTPKSANTNLSTLEVLMSWTKQLDENFKP